MTYYTGSYFWVVLGVYYMLTKFHQPNMMLTQIFNV